MRFAVSSPPFINTGAAVIINMEDQMNACRDVNFKIRADSKTIKKKKTHASFP